MAKNKVYCSECVHVVSPGVGVTIYCDVRPETSIEETFWVRRERKIYVRCEDRNKNNRCKDFEAKE